MSQKPVVTGGIDQDQGQCGRDAAHESQEISEVVILCQAMQTEVGEGGLVEGQWLPGHSSGNLVGRCPDKVKTGFSGFLVGVLVRQPHL